jgi:hypothetical protein
MFSVGPTDSSMPNIVGPSTAVDSTVLYKNSPLETRDTQQIEIGSGDAKTATMPKTSYRYMRSPPRITPASQTASQSPNYQN